jgi:hypothetical protein
LAKSCARSSSCFTYRQTTAFSSAALIPCLDMSPNSRLSACCLPLPTIVHRRN